MIWLWMASVALVLLVALLLYRVYVRLRVLYERNLVSLHLIEQTATRMSAYATAAEIFGAAEGSAVVRCKPDSKQEATVIVFPDPCVIPPLPKASNYLVSERTALDNVIILEGKRAAR